MKPNDDNGKLPTADRPLRVLLIAGSNRRQYNCPGVDSKARALMLRMAGRLPQEWEIDIEDLGNVYARERIQSCNACVSTSMALCVWPCLPASERVAGQSMRSVADLRAGDMISTGRVTRAWQSSPAGQVYRLRLSDGRQVRLTTNHRVNVIREIRREKVGRAWSYVWHTEWVEAAQLRPGDKVPFPMGEACGEFAPDSGLDLFYFLLAGLVFGDGSFAGADQAGLYFDARRPEFVASIAASSPYATTTRTQSYSSKDYGWPSSANPHMRYMAWGADVGRVLLGDIGLDKSTPVAERRLPASILNGSSAEVAAFLRGWFSTDGSVDIHGSTRRVSLASRSVYALREAQMLLAKLGIRSCVYDMSHKTVRMGERDYARASTLHIAKASAVAGFAELVGILGEKADRLTWPVAHKGGSTNRDYGRVVSLEPDGIEPVYDITVDGSHEFVAELVPVHNCNCYEKGDSKEPDLMWNLDLYARLDLADAWAVIGPVNWYAPSANLKLMFDRLVCMNGGNPREDLIDHKDPEKARALEHSAEWQELSVNHLEGRAAGFFCYGDGGGDELDEAGRPKILRHKEWFDPEREPFEEMRQSYAPLVWQCRYAGIEVPDALWAYGETGLGRKYSDNQAEDMVGDDAFMRGFDTWTDAFAASVGDRGKVEPGRYRAYGYEAPSHRWADAKLAWRDVRMRLGVPREGSSPAEQQRLGLNDDAVLGAKKSEGERVREGDHDGTTGGGGRG